MIKTILVRAMGDQTDTPVYATAAAVARLFGAHIDALHVRVDPAELATTMSTEGAGGPLLGGIIDSLTKDADSAEASARTLFSEFCRREELPSVTRPVEASGPSSRFNVETGQGAQWMGLYGLTADLAVASRGIPGSDAEARSTLEALLLATGRPLLIPGALAAPPDFADRITVAWKPTPQSARAVAFAMPFLSRAKHVRVLTVEEEEPRRDEAQRLVDYLGWYEIKSSVERLSPGAKGAASTMLAAAAARGGMLVMGGYGHTRFREWIFGGFTQFVLDHAEMPVLMAH